MKRCRNFNLSSRDRSWALQTVPQPTEDAVGRVPGGLRERPVPADALGCGGDGPEATCAETNDDEDDKADPADSCSHGAQSFAAVSQRSSWLANACRSLALKFDGPCLGVVIVFTPINGESLLRAITCTLGVEQRCRRIGSHTECPCLA